MVGLTGAGCGYRGGFVMGDLIVWDPAAAEHIERRTPQLSLGAHFDVEPAPDRAPYDFVVTAIRPNHIALCGRGRAGPECAIAADSIEFL